MILLRADWVAPMDLRPAFRDGAVVCSGGRILQIGDAAELRRDFPHAAEQDLGRCVLLPGLVNAHTHLELSDMTPGDPPASFVDWLPGVIRRTASRESIADAVMGGVEQCRRFGVTTIGDITREPEVTRPALAAGGLRAVSYGEVRALAQRRGLLEARLAAALEPPTPFGDIRIGVSPHAPYTVELGGYRRCLEEAARLSLPLTTHLAESPAEAQFLAAHAGPFRRLWVELGAWDEAVPFFHDADGSPMHFARAAGLLDYPLSLLAHVNYCDDGELDLLAAGRASVVYCPRTHEFFGHPPHRWREMLARGVNVAVGTDSCASSPDLNLVDDLRVLRRAAPDVAAETLWEMVTVRAAGAIGMQDTVGRLAAGTAADLVAFPAVGNTPLDEILREPMLPVGTWVGGGRVF